MKKNVVAPSVGESITEVSILKWAKQHGQSVKVGDLLLEIESDKATVEIVAEANGVLQILKQAGDRIPIGEIIGVIDDSLAASPSAAPPAPPGGPSASSPPPAPPSVPSNASAPPPPPGKTSTPPPAPGAVPSSPPPVPTPSTSSAPSAPPPVPSAPNGTLSPSVRRAAVQHHVDINQLQGSGKDGRVTKGDVLQAAEGSNSAATAPAAAASYGSPSAPPVSIAPSASSPSPSAPSAPAATPTVAPAAAKVDRPGDRRVPLSMMRQRIAERLVQAQHTAAILTTFNEVDLTAVMKIRTEHKDAFKAKHGVGLSFMSFFTKATVYALKQVPEVNAAIDGRDTVYHDYYDIGVAVGTDRGLVVPVIRGADQLDFVGIEKKIAELAVKGRDGKLSIADMTGGTFTISNGGTYGSLLSTPILNPPQSGILGMHKIMDRPVAMNGQVVIRPMMYLALSYDHRLIDGKGAVTFLVQLKEALESPEKLAFSY